MGPACEVGAQVGKCGERAWQDGWPVGYDTTARCVMSVVC